MRGHSTCSLWTKPQPNLLAFPPGINNLGAKSSGAPFLSEIPNRRVSSYEPHRHCA